MFRNWNLIKQLTIADFKIRYKGSLLGFAWSLLKPLLMLSILYFVFSYIIMFDIENYAFFLLLGIIIWNFFVDATSYSMQNLLSKRNLIRSVNFPRYILILSSCLNVLMTFIFNIIVFFIFLMLFGNIFSFKFLLLVFPLLFIFLFVLGISFIVTSFYVKYRDLTHIWGVALQIGFWVTPIVYSIEMVPVKFLTLFMLNPIARIIQYARSIILGGNFYSLYHYLVTFLICLGVLFIGIYIFNKRSKYFGESI